MDYCVSEVFPSSAINDAVLIPSFYEENDALALAKGNHLVVYSVEDEYVSEPKSFEIYGSIERLIPISYSNGLKSNLLVILTDLRACILKTDDNDQSHLITVSAGTLQNSWESSRVPIKYAIHPTCLIIQLEAYQLDLYPITSNCTLDDPFKIKVGRKSIIGFQFIGPVSKVTRLAVLTEEYNKPPMIHLFEIDLTNRIYSEDSSFAVTLNDAYFMIPYDVDEHSMVVVFSTQQATRVMYNELQPKTKTATIFTLDRLIKMAALTPEFHLAIDQANKLHCVNIKDVGEVSFVKIGNSPQPSELVAINSHLAFVASSKDDSVFLTINQENNTYNANVFDKIQSTGKIINFREHGDSIISIYERAVVESKLACEFLPFLQIECPGFLHIFSFYFEGKEANCFVFSDELSTSIMGQNIDSEFIDLSDMFDTSSPTYLFYQLGENSFLQVTGQKIWLYRYNEDLEDKMETNYTDLNLGESTVTQVSRYENTIAILTNENKIFFYDIIVTETLIETVDHNEIIENEVARIENDANDKPENENNDKPENENNDKPENENNDKPENENNDKPENENNDKPENENNDKPENENNGKQENENNGKQENENNGKQENENAEKDAKVNSEKENNENSSNGKIEEEKREDEAPQKKYKKLISYEIKMRDQIISECEQISSIALSNNFLATSSFNPDQISIYNFQDGNFSFARSIEIGPIIDIIFHNGSFYALSPTEKVTLVQPNLSTLTTLSCPGSHSSLKVIDDKHIIVCGPDPAVIFGYSKICPISIKDHILDATFSDDHINLLTNESLLLGKLSHAFYLNRSFSTNDKLLDIIQMEDLYAFIQYNSNCNQIVFYSIHSKTSEKFDLESILNDPERNIFDTLKKSENYVNHVVYNNDTLIIASTNQVLAYKLISDPSTGYKKLTRINLKKYQKQIFKFGAFRNYIYIQFCEEIQFFYPSFAEENTLTDPIFNIASNCRIMSLSVSNQLIAYSYSKKYICLYMFDDYNERKILLTERPYQSTETITSLSIINETVIYGTSHGSIFSLDLIPDVSGNQTSRFEIVAKEGFSTGEMIVKMVPMKNNSFIMAASASGMSLKIEKFRDKHPRFYDLYRLLSLKHTSVGMFRKEFQRCPKMKSYLISIIQMCDMDLLSSFEQLSQGEKKAILDGSDISLELANEILQFESE